MTDTASGHSTHCKSEEEQNARVIAVEMFQEKLPSMRETQSRGVPITSSQKGYGNIVTADSIDVTCTTDHVPVQSTPAVFSTSTSTNGAQKEVPAASKTAMIDVLIGESLATRGITRNQAKLLRRLRTMKKIFLPPFERVLPKIKAMYETEMTGTDANRKNEWETYMDDILKTMRYLKVSTREEFDELTISETAMLQLEFFVKKSICCFWQFLQAPEEYPNVGMPMNRSWLKAVSELDGKHGVEKNTLCRDPSDEQARGALRSSGEESNHREHADQVGDATGGHAPAMS